MHDLLGWLIDIESLYNRGYEIIDGLRFKNGAYINTGFRGTKGFGFDCSVRVDETNPDVSGYANYQAIGATRSGMTYNANMFAAINGASNSIIFATGSYTNAWNYNLGEEHFYEGIFVSGGSNHLKVDGKVIGGPFIVSWTQSNNANENVCIAKNSVSETIMGIVNIYDSSSNLVRKLFPAKRNTDGKFGYLDSIQGIFYPNVGGGIIEGIGSSDDEEWEWIFTKSTTKILRRNFPEKFGEIVAYAKRHPQIVPFINEDPMLVCSVVETGVVRLLHSDGTPGNIINTDIPLSEYAKVYLDFQYLSPNSHNDQYLFRSWGGNVTNNSMSVNKLSNQFRFFYGPYTDSVNNLTMNGNFNRHQIIMEKGSYTLDGVKTNRNWHLYDTSPACLQFFAASTTYGYCNAKIWEAKVNENTYGDCHFVPCNHKVNGEMKVGVLNLSQLKFYPAEGTIFIEYTLHDGSPWIPIR